MNVRKLCSVMKYLGQKAVPVLKGYARAKKTIISEMIYVGKREYWVHPANKRASVIWNLMNGTK